MTPLNNRGIPKNGSATVTPSRSNSITDKTLRTQAWAAFALSCLIPAMLVAYLTQEYIFPRSGSTPQVYSAIAFAFILVVCGAFLMLRIIRQVQRLSQSAKVITAVQAKRVPTPGKDDNELFHLGLAITKMGETLRNQVVELEDKAVELAELNQRLQDANRKLGQYNEMKSELVLLATREFRNPIGAIMEAASMILRRQLGDLNERQMRMLSVIHDNACKASRLLEELLAIARVRADNKDFSYHDTDLTATITEVLARISEVAERKGLRVSAALPREHIVISGYVQETELALDCVIAIAVELASEKTVFEVAAKQSEDSVDITIQVQPLSVTARAFEGLAGALNTTGYNVRDWSGIGSIELPLAKEIIHLLSGQIRVEQTPEHCFVFHIVLPKVPPAAESAEVTTAGERASGTT